MKAEERAREIVDYLFSFGKYLGRKAEPYPVKFVAESIREAEQQATERAAKVADNEAIYQNECIPKYPTRDHEYGRVVAGRIAFAIRERGECDGMGKRYGFRVIQDGEITVDLTQDDCHVVVGPSAHRHTVKGEWRMSVFKPYDKGDNDLMKIFEFEDGTPWQVVGYITEPAVILRSVNDPEESRTEVIGCLNSERWIKLVPQSKENGE